MKKNIKFDDVASFISKSAHFSAEFNDLAKLISKKFGIIEDNQPVIINGKKGFLVWDYIAFHEITFIDSESTEHVSMYRSFSKSKTKNKYDELLKQFFSK
ncbi:MAG: hypothetical protein R3Y64_06530 [Peptostreptococcaceae bacterium]